MANRSRSRSHSWSPPRRRRRQQSRSPSQQDEIDDFGRMIRPPPRDRSRQPRRQSHEGCRVFVGNLSFDTSNEAVAALFGRWGTVVDCHFPLDKATGGRRGFGFVTMSSTTEAEAAMAGANGAELDGRQIRVDMADKRRRKSEQPTRRVWGRPDLEDDGGDEHPDPDAAKPDFGLSGALAKDEKTGNMYKGHVLKWTEPEDAAKPIDRWRIYVFKDADVAETLHIHRQSAFLVGRIKEIADVLTMHPSCSGQHALIQFRAKRNPADPDSQFVLPYVMDLNSTNGTFLNDEKIEPARYIELRHKDVLKFGNSTRDYVLLNSSQEGAGQL